MKNKIIENTALLLSGFVIVYLLISFVNYDINADNWNINSRLVVTIFGFVLGIILILVRKITNEK